ncbi:MAG: DUF3037 domain-containing protein [Duncaniella sp.]|nr:DUF3037 domain-containing protein [Duncaniella sp.]
MNTEKNLYEWATLRIVPRIERDEFVNVGVIMMCKKRRWIRTGILIRPGLMEIFAPHLSQDELNRQLDAFEAVARGDKKAGPIASLEAEERFRWLTAVKSTWLQTSRPHPGMTDDLDGTFDTIMAEQVEE